MYDLYYSPGAASLAVHWMLIELGAPFTLRRVDISRGEHRQPAYLSLNPKGQVPTLVIDGRAHGESTALLMMLADRHPEAGFAPALRTPARDDYLELMISLANSLLPAFRALFYVADVASPEHQADALDFARRRIEAIFTQLDQRLADGRTYLLGADISAADFLLGMLARWSRKMPRPAETWPNLNAYVSRLKSRPGLREVHRREGLTDWIDGSVA